MMLAIFGCKMDSLQDLKKTVCDGFGEIEKYCVVKEVLLENDVFYHFSENLLEDQDWITDATCGWTVEGEFRCIRVINKETGERVLVNSNGTSYARYIAFEIPYICSLCSCKNTGKLAVNYLKVVNLLLNCMIKLLNEDEKDNSETKGYIQKQIRDASLLIEDTGMGFGN
ncbi:hypothetical protein QA612_17955 [Evansella sp. AB-P1]|uniref:hypothetical protein n=1 Tax=Evansella sp. AB-P1 TaxID=3037653 RepID=UPI00241CBA7C|nr:hypothetical protein [Evansella sp. AB-P1]MDG5789348.1 hypothetical protein [Evansella sp. AB-P1]